MDILSLYWTEEFRKEMRNSKSFETVADVAIKVVKTMPRPVYGISAPYTTGGFGLENNTKIIEACILELSSYELNIFNFLPLEAGISPLKAEWEKNNIGYCSPILNITYKKIFKYGNFKAVWRTSNWYTSEGCDKEDKIFRSLNIPIYSFPEIRFKQILEGLKLPEVVSV